MSNPLQATINEMINSKIRGMQNTFVGVISNYDKDRGVASITYDNIDAISKKVARNVPVSNTALNVFGDDPKMGDKAVISFIGGLHNPYIVAIIRTDREITTGKKTMPPDILQSYNYRW